MVALRFALGSLLCAWAALPAQSATEPFRVLRSGNPAQVSTAPALATIDTSPFDDAAGTLGDGASYYYLVVDSGDQPVPISVHKNPVHDAVRLSFDDGDEALALVGVPQSSVQVDPASIPADGVSMATVTIVPRDPFGIPLGTGLTVSADPAALLPGLPLGPVTDQGNGAYTLSVVSTLTGTGTVVIAVDALILTEQPSVTYEPVEEESRTIVERLVALIELLQAIVDANPGTPLEAELLEVIPNLQAAVDALDQEPPDTGTALDTVELAKEGIEDRAIPAGLDPELGDAIVDQLRAIKYELGWTGPGRGGRPGR